MEKRYQVFISSTFRDLLQERQAVLKAVLELDHMPAGRAVVALVARVLERRAVGLQQRHASGPGSFSDAGIVAVPIIVSSPSR